jgi:RNA polymerase sigma-70 factor (ECF subfamily)
MNSDALRKNRRTPKVPGGMRLLPGGNRSDGGASPAGEDRVLMDRIALQQPEALAALYDRHRGTVFGICARILGAGADAEEVLEEVFFEVWQRPQRYDAERSAPLSYLAVMARSRSIDRIRASGRRANAHERSRLLDPGSERKDALTGVVANEERNRAREAMATLRDSEREVVTLFYWGGLTHAEIAEQEGIPLGTVKTRIRRGLIRLKEVLVAEPSESST